MFFARRQPVIFNYRHVFIHLAVVNIADICVALLAGSMAANQSVTAAGIVAPGVPDDGVASSYSSVSTPMARINICAALRSDKRAVATQL